MTTTASMMLAGRYAVPGDVRLHPHTPLAGTDTALQQPVTVLAVPATPSSLALAHDRAAGRSGPGGEGLAEVLDVVEDGDLVVLVLAPCEGELLGERLRRGPLPTSAAAQVALCLLAARRSLRAHGSPGPAAIDPNTVLLEAEDRALLVPIPVDGPASSDDIGPVYALYTIMTTECRSVRGEQTSDGLRSDVGGWGRTWDGAAFVHHEPAASASSWGAPAAADDGPTDWVAIQERLEGETVRTQGDGRPRRRTAVVALVAALNLLVLGTVGAAIWFHSTPRPAPAAAPAPITATPPPKPAPPTTVPGLLADVTRQPAAAGADGTVLRDELAAVASSAAETRRQHAVRVLTLATKGRLTPEYARAATTAVTPLTKLDTPADVIADLSPNPAPGGPNAHFVLNCMLDLQGKPAASQRDESGEILEKIPGWAAGGGIQPDLVAAVVRIVTPVAHGTAVFTDAQTGFDPTKPRPADGS